MNNLMTECLGNCAATVTPRARVMRFRGFNVVVDALQLRAHCICVTYDFVKTCWYGKTSKKVSLIRFAIAEVLVRSAFVESTHIIGWTSAQTLHRPVNRSNELAWQIPRGFAGYG